MKKLLITAAIITATLAVGCSTPTDTTNAAPDTENVGGNIAADEGPCLDKDAAIDASNLSLDALTKAQKALGQYDVSGAVTYLHLTADYTRQSGDLTAAAVPAVATSLYAAADAYDASADALAEMDIDTSTVELKQATEFVDQATSALDASNPTVC